MSEITLSYFDLNAKGDFIRLALHLANVDFKDNRFGFQQWGSLKASGDFDFQQAPLLEIDGLKLVQSRAIMEYIGAKYDLAPTDPLSRFLTSYYIDATDELYAIVYKDIVWAKDEESKTKAIEKLKNETLPVYLPALEKRFLDNKSDQSGFLVGNKPSIADARVVTFFDMAFREPSRKDRLYPTLQSLAPNFANYVEAKISGDFKSYFDSERRPTRDR